MAVQAWLPVPNDPKTNIYGTVPQESALLREILRRTRTLSGVEETAIGNVDSLPLGHGRDDLNMSPLIREGQDLNDNQAPQIDTSTVSPEYFHMLGMTLVRGRLFNNQDVADTPMIALINEAAARTYWPGQDPVGKHVRLDPNKPVWVSIAGVIADARTESLADAGTPHLYLSAFQHRANDLVIFLRGQLDPGAMAAQVRTQVQSIDAELPVFQAQTLDDVLADSLTVRRFAMELIALFAAMALLLAALGIYGTISYLVSERTHEIGIRLALGANRSKIMRMVLRQGLELAIAGAAAGLIGAIVVSRLMAGLLYGVAPYDPLTFAGVTFVLTAVALAACYIPARRATRVDPMFALREE
jgi:putative ABC transport system permease protein